MDVAGAIRNGQTDIGMSVGVESLSTQRRQGKNDHIWTPGVFETSGPGPPAALKRHSGFP